MTTIIAILCCIIMLITTIMIICFVIRFNKMIKILAPYLNNNNYKETHATLVGFKRYPDKNPYGKEYIALIEYHDEYQNTMITKECLNIGIFHPDEAITTKEQTKIGHMGEKIKIQYTPISVRIADEKYCNLNHHKPMYYARPIILCMIIYIIAAILCNTLT